MIAITDIMGDTKQVNGIKSVVRSRKVNGEKTLTLIAVPTDANAHSFDSVDTESRFTFQGEPYIIKKVQEKNMGRLSIKSAEAVHSFFDDMINSFQYETFTGSQTFAAALQRVFGPTAYNFSIVDSFLSEEFENFGSDNCLALFQTVLERYGAEFEVIGRQVYLKRSIGARTGFQLRWKHNIKAIDKQVDTENLATYIKGYGKPKEETDVLSGQKIPYASKSGVYLTGRHFNTTTTEDISATFRFSFTGTGFRFQTGVHRMGGVWQFDVDGQKYDVSTYRDVTYQEQLLEVVRGLEHKTYNVVATFIGKDSKNPNTKATGANTPKPFNVLLSGDIIGLYRELVGDERFAVTAEYTSPNASKYPSPSSADGLRHAEPISDEKITSTATMLEKLKKTLQDEPRLSITVDIAQIDGEVQNEGDYGYIIYDPMKIKVEARAVEITETFEFIDRKWKVRSKSVSLDNLQNKITDVTTRFQQTSKQFDRLMQGKDKLPYNVLPEAVRIASEAINNSLTEVQYPPNQGIVLQDPNNPSRLVRLSSAGIGVSDDGGATYRTAMTGFGMVADEIVTGVLRANNVMIQGEKDLFFWDGTGLWAYNPNDMTKYVKLTSAGLYIAKGAITIERPDGYKIVDNGMSVFDVNIQGAEPTFHSPGVSLVQRSYAQWLATKSTQSVDFNQYSFEHKARYLKVRYRVLADPGNTAHFEIWKDGQIVASAYTAQSDEYSDGVLNGFTLTVDLGVPTGQPGTFQIRIRSEDSTKNAYAMVSRKWLEG